MITQPHTVTGMVDVLRGCTTLGEVAETLRSWDAERHEQPPPYAAAQAALTALADGRMPDDPDTALLELETACDRLRA